MIPDELFAIPSGAAQIQDDLRRAFVGEQWAVDEAQLAIRMQVRRQSDGFKYSPDLGWLGSDEGDDDGGEMGDAVAVHLLHSYKGIAAGSVRLMPRALAESLAGIGWVRAATQEEWDAMESPPPQREHADICAGLRTARIIHATEFLPRQAA